VYMFHDLKNKVPNKELELSGILLVMNWFKLYDTASVLSGRWGYHEETCRKRAKQIIAGMIHSLKEEKIKWIEFDDNETFWISMDGVHCRIQEPRKDPGAKWYDHKSNGAGVAYEIALAIRSSNCLLLRHKFCLRSQFFKTSCCTTVYKSSC
jgi:hypothetical protein